MALFDLVASLADGSWLNDSGESRATRQKCTVALMRTAASFGGFAKFGQDGCTGGLRKDLETISRPV
jgi:hypothetical protein